MRFYCFQRVGVNEWSYLHDLRTSATCKSRNNNSNDFESDLEPISLAFHNNEY